MRSRILIIAVSLTQILSSCDGFDKGEEEFRPGYILLDSAYDFGDIKNTKTISFQFSNEGDTDLVGISLESSDSSFVISPSYIPVLKPRDKQSLTQNIQISAVHGSDPEGLGFLELMPPGLNEANLFIRAKTTDLHGDTLRISEHAALSAFAQIVDVEVSDVNKVVPLNNPFHNSNTPNISPWPIRSYRVANGPLTIKNTGNVDLSIRVFRRTSEIFHVFDETDFWLSAGRDTTIDRDSEDMAFRINGGNTITYPDLLQIQPDGFIYIKYLL